MAVRTGAGTGVIVSLVVFVLTTVALLVLTIVFYTAKTKEMEAKANAIAALEVYARQNQRSSDLFKNFESEAKSRNQSVAQYLNERYESAMEFVAGSRTMTLDQLRTNMSRYGVPQQGSIASHMQAMYRDLNASQTQINGLNEQLASLTNEIQAKEQQIAQLKQSHQQEMDAIEARIASYRNAAEDYRQRVDTAVSELNRAKEDLKNRYEGEINDLIAANNDLGREREYLLAKIRELERARNADRIKAQDPSTLVDARIIDAPGSSDQVYIDRGRRDRIVRGMTFEVYSDAAQIRVNPTTGELPRGKASLQVMSVGETTSTCKITRSVPGQPIVRGDVVANAVYDPTYRFKFLVHGRFDINNDGVPTEEEAEYLRSLVMEWGGIVVSGDTLPGDLDFLVLGEVPPNPPPLPADPPRVLIDDWARKRAAREKYQELFDQASNAQIPVLNANRFFTLIGHTDR